MQFSQLQNVKYILFITLSLVVSNPSFASTKNGQGRAADLGGPIQGPSLSTGVVLHTDYSLSGSFGTDGYLVIAADLNARVRAVLKLELERIFMAEGQQVPQDFNIEKFIEEAFIKFHNDHGKLAAVVIGKQPIPVGSEVSRMPNDHNGPTHGATEIKEVFGITLTFRDIGFFDLVQIAGFESKEGDLNIGSIDGASIRLTKQLTETLSLRLSAAQVKRQNLEKLVSVGFIQRSGKWNFYGDFVYRRGHTRRATEHSPIYEHDQEHDQEHETGHGHDDITWSGDYSAMLGLSRKLGPGVATMEITYIDRTLLQLGIGYSLDITENLSVGAEVRHTQKDSGERDTAVFVRMTVKLGSSVGKDEHDHGDEDEDEDDHGDDHEDEDKHQDNRKVR